MPRAAFHRARRRVVAGNRQHIRLFPEQDWQCGIEILDGLFLRVKIAVLAIHVGILVVDEKKVVLVVFGEITLELFGDGLWPDRKSTRLNSSHLVISYAVFCLKKKNT